MVGLSTCFTKHFLPLTGVTGPPEHRPAVSSKHTRTYHKGYPESSSVQTYKSLLDVTINRATLCIIIIIIMYIYHALINALSAHMIHINLNMIFYTHV